MPHRVRKLDNGIQRSDYPLSQPSLGELRSASQTTVIVFQKALLKPVDHADNRSPLIVDAYPVSRREHPLHSGPRGIGERWLIGVTAFLGRPDHRNPLTISVYFSAMASSQIISKFSALLSSAALKVSMAGVV